MEMINTRVTTFEKIIYPIVMQFGPLNASLMKVLLIWFELHKKNVVKLFYFHILDKELSIRISNFHGVLKCLGR